MDLSEDCDNKIKIEYVERCESIIDEPVLGTKTRIVTENEFKLTQGYKFDSDVQFEESKVTLGLRESPPPPSPNFECGSSALHKRVKTFQCTICLKKFPTNSERHRHMKMNTDLRPLKCVEKYYFIRPPPYKCDLCAHTVNSKSKLRPHMKVHTGEKSFKCNECSRRFAERGNLKQHIQWHIRQRQPLLSPTFECYICGDGLKYKRKMYLKIHMREFHVDGAKFTCSICPKKYSYKKDLNRHLLVHNDSEPTIVATSTTNTSTVKLYKCPTCDYTSKYNNHLKIHIRRHNGERPYKCDQCPKAFSCISHLQRHARSVHVNLKILKCKECPKRFNDKSSLNLHVQRKHLGYKAPKKFKCLVCLLRVQSKTYLEKHLRSHTLEKPFSCSKCSRAFSLKSNLDRHSRDVKCLTASSVNKTEKPTKDDKRKSVHKCEVCSKTYQRQEYLTRHLRSHTVTHTTKKFECYFCRFTPEVGDQRAKNCMRRLIRHMRKHSSCKTVNNEVQRHIANTHANLDRPSDKIISTRSRRASRLTRKLQCSHCTFESAFQPFLMDHLMGIHCISFNCSVKLSKV